MNPNAMPKRITKARKPVRKPRPIRNTQLADQLKNINLKGNN